MTDNKSVRGKTIKGVAWSLTELVSKQGIQLLTQIILARLLLPEHFGLIGMVTIFIAISNSLIYSGMDQALIRIDKPSQEDYSTVFYFNLAVSVAIYFVLYFSAPLISSFFNEPQLIEIIRVLMIIVIINALGVTQRVILIRKVDFRTQTRITTIAGIVSGIVAVSFAMSGYGVWSLVALTMTMQIVQVLLLFLNNRWFPSLSFNVESFKNFFTFGYKLLIAGLIDTIYKNIYLVIIGRLYPTALLGYYTNASKLRDVSSQSITQAIQKVTYPILSSIKAEPHRLSRNYIKIIKVTAYLNFPFMLGLAAVAPNAIPLLLGEQWIPSVIYFQLLCLAGMLYPIHSVNLNILKVKGRSELFLRLEIIKKSILTILIVLAVVFDTGVIGLIIAAIVNSYISLFINMYYSGREISYNYFKQIKDLFPTFLSATIMGGVAYLSSYYLTEIYFVDLVLQIMIGVAAYLLLSMIFKLEAFKELLGILMRKRAKE